MIKDWAFKCICTFLLFLGATQFSVGQIPSSKIAPSVWENAREEPTPFLIWLKAKADLTEAASFRTKEEKGIWAWSTLRETYEQSQKDIVKLLNEHGAPFHRLSLVNVIITRGDRELIAKLANLSQVKHIVPDPEIRREAPIPESEGPIGRQGIEWGISKIGAHQVWELGITGQGIVVGGQDTGYDWTHPALKTQYRGYHNASEAYHDYNWHDAIRMLSPIRDDGTGSEADNRCGFESPEPCDDGRHGTHTMGTIVGDDQKGNQIGVAPDAKWIGCRNMERGIGWPSTYLECFDWLLAPNDLQNRNPDPTRAPHVINNSWYCPESEGCTPENWSLLEEAVEVLRSAGIVVVISAGNRGPSCETADNAPSRFPASFSVGATNDMDAIADFSSRGPVVENESFWLKPNVVAPGVRVRSAVPDNDYRSFSGTSMAGPHVVGAIALILSANPSLAGQVEQIEHLLEETAVPLFSDQSCEPLSGNDHPNGVYGFGRIDAYLAVQAALKLENEAINRSPFQVYPNPVSSFLFVSGKEVFGQVNLSILNLNGQLLLERQANTEGILAQKLDLGFLPSGTYLVRIQSPTDTQTFRILIP